MVERTTAQGLNEFVGTAKTIVLEQSKLEGMGSQWHISIVPEDKTILKESKTGMFHEWVRVSDKATEKSVPEGSILDLFLKEVESAFPEAKKLSTIAEELEVLKDKRILWRKKTLGKAYKGYPASEHWVPISKQ